MLVLGSITELTLIVHVQAVYGYHLTIIYVFLWVYFIHLFNTLQIRLYIII